MAHAPSDWVEIFRTDSTVEARRVLDTLLVPAGIAGDIRDRVNRVMPAPASQPGEIAIAVAPEDVDRAVSILREAEEDGYIDGSDAAISSPTQI
jgi:hypothetical protein